MLSLRYLCFMFSLTYQMTIAGQEDGWRSGSLTFTNWSEAKGRMRQKLVEMRGKDAMLHAYVVKQVRLWMWQDISRRDLVSRRSWPSTTTSIAQQYIALSHIVSKAIDRCQSIHSSYAHWPHRDMASHKFVWHFIALVYHGHLPGQDRTGQDRTGLVHT